MKRLLNYTIILLLSLVVFGCGGPTIDKNSDNYQHIERNTISGFTYYSGEVFSGEIVEYYEGGQLKEKMTFKEGKKDGVSESYYENGKLKTKLTYKEGKQDGVSELYYKNGQLEYMFTYKEGKKDGVSELYYENGQLEYRWNHKDGNLME